MDERQIRILMIDDSELTLDFQAMLLERHGFDVRTCISVDDVAGEIEGWTPDAILCDVNMPDVEGPDICPRLRGHAVLADIPIILCSGLEAEELARTAGAWGADGHISKSEGIEDLPHLLRELCDPQGSTLG
ncbi:MAG: response regulator [Polyangiaceae bacterium]